MEGKRTEASVTIGLEVTARPSRYASTNRVPTLHSTSTDSPRPCFAQDRRDTRPGVRHADSRAGDLRECVGGSVHPWRCRTAAKGNTFAIFGPWRVWFCTPGSAETDVVRVIVDYDIPSVHKRRKLSVAEMAQNRQAMPPVRSRSLEKSSGIVGSSLTLGTDSAHASLRTG